MSSASRSSPAAPAPDRLLALADRCVQCGLCLPACPTYELERTESESPRGRIALVRAWALGTIESTVTADRHLDHCLDCRNCEAVCPAGVQFGELLVEARVRQRARRGSDWKQSCAEWLTARPRLISLLLGVYFRLFPALPTSWRKLPRPPAPAPAPAVGASSPAGDSSAPVESAALFMGCIARRYEAGLREAVSRLCTAAGAQVRIPASQTCCGTLHAHAGDTGTRAHLARLNRNAFSGHGTVLTLASGCHEAVAEALLDTATTMDAIDFLARRVERLRFQECRELVALHLPCTQRNVVKSVGALRALLARVPGLEVIELTAGDGCCGAAGTRMLLDPARAAAHREPLLAQFQSSGATRLLSANIGCRLHLANATSKPVQHPLEFLARLI